MKTQKIKSLQTMRFFAAIGIAQFHLWQNYFGITIGEPGTDIFLVLAGVVTAYTQAKLIGEINWLEYIGSRYIRLYVTFIPLFVITLIAKWNIADLNWILKSFFFIPISDRLPIIGGTWMLSMFILFYFIFSVCFLAKTEKIIWGLFIIWVTLIATYNMSTLKTGLPENWQNLIFTARNLEIIFGYIVGVVLRNQWVQGRYSIIFLGAGLFGIIGGTFLLNVGIIPNGRVITIGLPVAVFILGLANYEIKKIDLGILRFSLNPWLVWVGGTSYVLFLSHGLFYQGWSRILPVKPIWVLPMSLGAIIVGALGYIFWERPVLTIIKSKKSIKPNYPITKSKIQNL